MNTRKLNYWEVGKKINYEKNANDISSRCLILHQGKVMRWKITKADDDNRDCCLWSEETGYCADWAYALLLGWSKLVIRDEILKELKLIWVRHFHSKHLSHVLASDCLDLLLAFTINRKPRTEKIDSVNPLQWPFFQFKIRAKNPSLSMCIFC